MKINWTKLAVSLVTPLLVGWSGSLLTLSEITGWYQGLNKPGLVPPNGVFGPVWTSLYLMMGISLYLVWSGGKKVNRKAYLVFGGQLLLNFMWSLLFFRYHSPALASVEIVILWLAIVLNIKEFFRYSKTAGYLLIPYLVWVTFASYLTWSVWWLN